MHPELGAPDRAGTRRVQIQRCPFSIIYRIQPEQLIVVAVAHHRRRPGYWQGRV
jgi:hypothetical protein